MFSIRAFLFIAATVLLASCATTRDAVPSRPLDACATLRENNWGKPLGKASRKWGARAGVILAVMYQESGFNPDARPARQGGFLFIPGKRPSNAYGYAQAKDATWNQYQENGGGTFARRDKFEDAADFIGWYLAQTEQRTGVPRNDAAKQYLAYHEGAGGYLRGTYRQKKWLVKTADTVAKNAAAYERQISHCSSELGSGRGLFGLMPF